MHEPHQQHTLPLEPQAPHQTRPYNHGLHRVQGGNAWRAVLAVGMVAAGYLILMVPVSLVVLLEGDSPGMAITPGVTLAMNLSMASLWPLSLLAQRVLYGVRPGQLHSVAGRIRWRLVVMLAAVLVPLYLVFALTNPLYMPTQTGPFTAVSAAFLVIGLLTTPLQSAGEEVFFRGLLPRAVGSLFRTHRVALVVGVVISTVVFALMHGAGDMWLNAYYVVFGAALAVITWRTQGLEGAIIAHAANNTFVMIVNTSLGWTDFDETLEREAGTGGPFMLIAMAVAVLAAAAVWWRTRHPRVQRTLQLPEVPPSVPQRPGT